MNASPSPIQDALRWADETRAMQIGRGILAETPALFRAQFGGQRALVVADPHTFAAAGKEVADAFTRAGHPADEPFLFTDGKLYAEHGYVEELEAVLKQTEAVPVAVGSGSINDIVKLAAHRTGRAYLSVATAASMDGYTAFGASITWQGSKQTFACPAPRAVLADLGVIAAAPAPLNASGYADLLAKVTAGADWIVADALGVEALEPTAWRLVQTPLRGWLDDPEGVRRGDLRAIENLVEGLLMGGFAMQWTKSSRCASGAEHQFSHLWDMEHHVHEGRAPSHGFKVGIGTLTSARLYERLLSLPLAELPAEKLAAAWPDWPAQEREIRALYGIEEITAKALEESRAKFSTRTELAAHLRRVQTAWPALAEKLRAHLIPAAELRQMLAAAGAPTGAPDIGITPGRLRASHRQAYHLRRRYTVLDLAVRCGVLDSCLDHPGTGPAA